MTESYLGGRRIEHTWRMFNKNSQALWIAMTWVL